jgi:hypothetical protein
MNRFPFCVSANDTTSPVSPGRRKCPTVLPFTVTNVAVKHQLTGRARGRGEPQPADHVVEPGFQEAQQVFAGVPFLVSGHREQASELAFQERPRCGGLFVFHADVFRIPWVSPRGDGRVDPGERRRPLYRWGTWRNSGRPSKRASHPRADKACRLDLCIEPQNLRYKFSPHKTLDASRFGRAASVVRNRRHVFDRGDHKARPLERADRGFPPRARAFDENRHGLHAQPDGFLAALSAVT